MSRGHQKGMSLVELLVALSLGAMLMLAASAMLLAASSSYADQADYARLSDNGRYALDTIARAVRQTAYVNWDASATPLMHAPYDSANIAGLDARSLGKNSAGISLPLTNAVNGSDVLALRYDGAGKDVGGDGSVLNCAGFGLGAAHTQAQRGWSIFYVARDDAGEAELRCKYRSASGGWGADAIIRGVDSFQVLYGLDTDNPPDGVPNQYVSASELAARDAALVLVGMDEAALQRDLNQRTHWKRVASVRVALLLHGEAAQRTKAQPGPAQFDLFGAAYADAYGASDTGVRIVRATLPLIQQGRSYHLVQLTIMLRNMPG
ncbi:MULTISPECIES: PilW family protein [unclassified Janthinobacterium]|uniref:PilW family protein n=1 Tax=unclassified Janthinobacterium TaxID=2610881 RepID=UPI00185EDCC6|nr:MULTISPECIES: PilW family protein [unclassified Janthinobacterium]MBB5369360.1 type IV pilus assembly protein PilW [Janthinobacterium sp. K2C7]MBB5381104.1 type IV pilus assembly protein PilW [Janthinobacterium sp. K2Li3]MBB5387743.1 type IV pilus assembly protein PilW [Janthinobacterium sp. K2E3]